MKKTSFLEGIIQKISSGKSILGSGFASKKIAAFLRSLLDSIQIACRPDANAMVLRQSYAWSRGMLWTIIFVIIAVVLWSCIAEMDEVIHAVGKLQPRGSAREVQTPVGGVISENLVREGQSVKSGDPLVRLDTKVASAELRSIEDQLGSMQAEEAFYNQLFQRGETPALPVSLPPDILDLAKNHASLVAEDRLLRAILNASSDGADLNIDQKKLFTEEQKDRLEKYERIKGQLEQARLLEANSKKVLDAYTRLLASGAGSKVDFLAREAAWIESVAKVKGLEVEQENTITTFRKDAMTRLSENTKRLAEIESNLTKIRLSNSQRIAETVGRWEAAKEQLNHHEIKSPASGIVFEVVAGKPGTVVGAKDSILKILPSEELIAKVDITNKDIGFIKMGLPCEVEVDTFPKREFGFVEGEVFYVSSDVIAPTEVKQFYSFPAKISLNKQNLSVRGKDVALQSGMAVSANIKIRKRRVIMLFLDNILGPIDKMKEVR
jgi:hemolysin D